MPDPTQFDPDRLRVALDHGEVVELDGGTLVLDGQESPSVVLRLALWRARSVARVLQERTVGVADLPPHGSATAGRAGVVADAGVGGCSTPVAAMSRSCGRLAVRVLSLLGNAWLL
ncbi:MAG TPA: hypothetical protein VK784_07205 [Pseudonocardiaceae bacterium]|jgi:hypothetical protein|nr:hypothetical protein [Pseudonocardiaceae bacterium]